MSVVIVSEHLPLADGTPAQRRAAALSAILRGYGARAWITMDTDRSQHEDRLRIDRATRFYPFSPPGVGGQPATLNAFGALNTAASAKPSFWESIGGKAAFESGWMNVRRARRIADVIRAAKPDLLILDGVVGAPFAGLCGRVLHLDRCEAEVHSALSAAVTDREQGEWHRIVAEGYAARTATAWTGDLVTLADDSSFAAHPAETLPGASLSQLREAMLLVAGTGYSHLDRLILDRLRSDAAALDGGDGVPFQTALIGTGRVAAEPVLRIEQRSGWATLSSSLLRARAVYVPFEGAGSRDIVPLALASGVPVITTRSVARRHGLDVQDGVLVAEHADDVRRLLARLMPATLDIGDAIADRAKRRGDASRATLRSAIDAAIGRRAKDETVSFSAPRRYSALAVPPVLQYFAPTRMLLAKLTLRRGAMIDEVRVLDAAGRMLTSFLPRSPEGAPASYDIEGGGIIDAVPGDAAIYVELRCEGVVAELIAVPAERVIRIAAEIVSLEKISHNAMRGLAWVTAGIGSDNERLAVSYGGRSLPIAGSRIRALPDIGLSAVSFQVFGNGDPLAGSPIELTGGNDALDQRPLALTRRIIADDPPRRAELAALAGIHAGRRGWMIGNGPSVRLEDLDRIPDGDIVFAFNRFYLAHGDTTLREDYVVSADTLMLADFGQEMIQRSSGLPLFCVGKLDQLQGFTGKFVALDTCDAIHPLFSTDPGRFVSVGGSSVYVALQMAYFMGIRDIALYGMDFSFNMTPQRHPAYPFPVSFDEGNHFIKGYRSAKPWCPPTWRDIAAAFLNARIFFELNGGSITNATRGGKLEIFRRGDFDALVPVPAEAA